MQTRKKVGGKVSGEVVSPRSLRYQKKASENLHVQGKKASDLITSSARKHKNGRTLSKKTEEPAAATNLVSKFESVNDETASLSMDDHENNSTLMTLQGCDGAVVDHMVGTLFSPAFHIPRSVEEEITSEDFLKFFKHEDQHLDQGKDNMHVDFRGAHVTHGNNFKNNEALETNLTCPDLGSTVPSEISAVYDSVNIQKLECSDEYNQGQMPANVCYDDEEVEEDYDDFDPFFFMKSLPDLYSVVPVHRPVLLPKQTRSCPSTTLVLDLDETLVHSTLEPCDDADFTFTVNFNLTEHTVYVRCRPHLRDFMERLSGRFEIIIFTASQSIYAEQLLNVLDPKRKVFRHRVFRESCVLVDGNYLKDLTVLGRDLAHTIIIDNSPQAFGFQIDNGIPIESWFDDQSDTELLLLIPFLESLVGVEDVRPLIAKKFNLRGKVAAAVCPLKS